MDTERKQTIFEQLVQIVKANITNDFAVESGLNRLDVNTQKPVEIAGRKKPNLNLLSVIPQKHHIGFYFMPVYVDEKIRANLSEDLAKMLKGKSCFHCKQELSPEMEAEIANLIQQGIALYSQKDWL